MCLSRYAWSLARLDGVGAVRYLFKRVVTCVLRGCVIDRAKHTPKALVQANPEYYCRTLGLPSRARILVKVL
jgi:hypothetical protein